MSGARVRRRVEEEARAEEAWSLEDYEWDPVTCVARKRRMVAPGEAAGTTAAVDAVRLASLEGAVACVPQAYAADNPRLASLPVLETVDRTDAEPATVCEVVGCGVSLEGLKRYYVRMRVCERHLHAPAIVVNGVVSRFCQQCAKFHFVGEFSGGKKSCVATLERHNARHRAKVLARMQDMNDGDSDSPPTGGRAKGRPKAAAGARRKAGQPPASGAAGRGGGGAAAAARTVTEHTYSGATSGSGAPEGFCWAPPPPVAAGAQPITTAVLDISGGGAFMAGQAPAAAATPGTRAISAGVPMLSAEATAPSKPASPHPPTNAWDGASSALVELPPRPQVTTGLSGVVPAGNRNGAGAGPPQLPPQQLQHTASMPAAWPPFEQVQQLPYDVRSGLAAVQGQLLADAPHSGGMAQGLHTTAGGGGGGHGAMHAVPMWHHHQPTAGFPGGPTRRSQIAAPSSAGGDGGTSSASDALATPGSGASAVEAPKATGRHAFQAAAGAGGFGAFGDGAYPGDGAAAVVPGVLYGNEVFQRAETTGSGGIRQSEAEPCGSSGRVAMNAASPAFSQDEGASATRVSASGAGAGDGGAADASAPLQAGNVAARISSIMQELCPLIEQFKQEVTQGSAGYHESAFAAAAVTAPDGAAGCNVAAAAPVGTSPPPLLAAAAEPGGAGGGQVAARDRGGSSSLSPLMDTAMVMMQQASQLAASLQQSRSGPPQHVWTVTSGGPEACLPGAGLPAPPQEASLGSQGSGLMQANSNPPPPLQLLQPQAQQRTAQNPPAWRPLASHPGVVVNAAAAQQAATSVAAATGGGGAVPAAAAARPLPAALPRHLAGDALAMSASPTSRATTAIVTTINHQVGNGGYPGPVLPAGAMEAGGPGGGGGSFSGGAGFAVGPAAGVVKGNDSDDEMFKELMTLLQDEEGGDELAEQQLLQQHQQQQLFQGIASSAQHAVGLHQQAVQAMPYGHVPVSPFYWPPAAGPAHPQPYLPPAPTLHHHQHPHNPHPQHHFQAHPYPAHSPFAWPNPGAVAALHVEEPDDVDPRELTRVSLKAMNVLPHELPSNMRSNLRRWLKESRAEALQATLRPGCLQLVVDVVRSPSASASAAAAVELSSVLIPANDADQAAADVFRLLGQRLRDTYVQVDRRVLQMRVGERPVVLSWEEAAEDGGLDGAKYPSLKGCSTAAVCAGTEAVLQLSGGHVAQPGTKVFARLRGHDLRTALLPATSNDTQPPGGAGGSVRMSVAVPPGSVGLMAVEVGVGHLLGDWWPVLVLPPGCEGAAAEVRGLQADAEAQPAAAADAAGRAFRRLLLDLANVLEVFSDAAAADASAAAANAAAAAAASAAAHARSSSGDRAAGPVAAATPAGAGDAAAPAGAAGSPPSERRCGSPSGGTSSSVARSDASFTAVSAYGWSVAGRTDTLMSTNVGSTLGSFMTTSSALASTSMEMALGQGQAHAQALAVGQAQHSAAAAAAADSALGPAAGGAAVAAAAIPQIALLPPPPTATMRKALSRAARLLRFAVARGLPRLTALLLAAANCLARALDGNRQPSQPPPQPSQQPPSAQQASALSRAQLLAAAGVDPQALLPLGVVSGSAATVDALMLFAARVLGSPLRLDLPQGPCGLSALHLAALLPDGGALASHLLATQPWAAWEWLSLGWTPPPQLLGQGQGSDAAAGSAANSGAAAVAKAARAVEEEEEEEEEGETLAPAAPRLTPGSLSVLLGGQSTVRKAVEVLVARRGDGALARWQGDDAAGAAALVAAVEAWGRTGVALLDALCSQLAQQRL